MSDDIRLIAIPLAEGKLAQHFGHCEQFAIFKVAGCKVIDKSEVTPPPHEPGILPPWLGGKGVNTIITGGMGGRALQLFGNQKIDVITGAPSDFPEAIIEKFLNGSLVTSGNACDH